MKSRIRSVYANERVCSAIPHNGRKTEKYDSTVLLEKKRGLVVRLERHG